MKQLTNLLNKLNASEFVAAHRGVLLFVLGFIAGAVIL